MLGSIEWECLDPPTRGHLTCREPRLVPWSPGDSRDPVPSSGFGALRPGEVDDEQLAAEVAAWMMDESQEVTLWRDPHVVEPACLLRFEQGLPDGVFEPRPGGQGPDNGQVSRRTPVRRTDVLGD